jgi:hypothetical protein
MSKEPRQTLRTMKLRSLTLFAAVAATAPGLRATESAISSSAFTGDVNSGGSLSKTYLATANLIGADVTVNGVTFIGSGVGLSGVGWALTGLPNTCGGGGNHTTTFGASTIDDLFDRAPGPELAAKCHREITAACQRDGGGRIAEHREIRGCMPAPGRALHQRHQGEHRHHDDLMAKFHPDAEPGECDGRRGGAHFLHGLEETSGEAKAMEEPKSERDEESVSAGCAARVSDILHGHDNDAECDHWLNHARRKPHQLEGGESEREGVSEGEGSDDLH